MAARATSGGSPTVRRLVYTGAFAAVTIMGTWYGAGLKTQQEAKTERKKIVEASAEQKIALLEQRRAQLVTQKIPLDKKLASLRERMGKRKEADGEDQGK
ncbi:hypothetical protein NKR23_g1540 [Pleurostoma richardsiae]|uniref:Uncharacterized protein n=1 Tax=Pleurostoma richardsiae TaxID=41990 RepID=A0AA38VVU0_9PEZI|nr:hypothetical protein NKR23_g1540 [Pleurostoma richardsiae]